MSENAWSVVLVRHAILKSMAKDERGIHGAPAIYLSSWLAKIFRDGLAETKRTPTPDAYVPPQPKETPRDGDIRVCNFDGVEIIERPDAYQPITVGERILLSPARK